MYVQEHKMQKLKFFSLSLLSLLLLFSANQAWSCSMYKITVGDKTMVGCNEDAWRTSPRIWFEIGDGTTSYGAAFTGSRYDGSNGFAPQSGMNEFGLCFSRLAASPPKENPTSSVIKKTINNPTQYLKDILHNCKTVAEVQSYIEAYDYSFFNEDVFIYIDQSGDYLVVEPYCLTLGHEPTYVLSNFCPSCTPQAKALKLDRYLKGVTFLQNKQDSSLSFCTALSDTMHVCRARNGDGTLLTSIWDLKNGIVTLYFYHNYKNYIQFNIKDEIAKGNHQLEIPALFPPNKEFERLATYSIPQNNRNMMLFLIFCAGLFAVSAFYFIFSFFESRRTSKYPYVKLLLVPLNLMLLYYMYVLARNINLFYFDAPYQDVEFSLLNLAAYLPFLLILLIIPLWLFNIKILKEKSWMLFPRLLFTFNNAVYIVLICLFAYWGFYSVVG